MPKRRQRPTTTLFPPGAPLVPIPGLTPPDGSSRQWAYPVGYNIGQRPRATEQTSFEQLRNLAALYDGIQIWIRSLQIVGEVRPNGHGIFGLNMWSTRPCDTITENGPESPH
jgi:hypothetical protein